MAVSPPRWSAGANWPCLYKQSHIYFQNDGFTTPLLAGDAAAGTRKAVTLLLADRWRPSETGLDDCVQFRVQQSAELGS